MNSFDWYVKLRWSNSLEKYNFWSIISLGITPILGFLFWIICAKKYEDQSLGIAITIIGLANIIALVSRLGMDEGLKRYKYNNKEDVKNQLNSILWICLILSIFLSPIGLFIIRAFLLVDLRLIILFVLLTSSISVSYLLNGVLASENNFVWIFLKNFIGGTLKLSIVILLVNNFENIINSWIIGNWIINFLIIMIKRKLFFKGNGSLKLLSNFDIKSKFFKYSILNLFYGLANTLIPNILPSILTLYYGFEEAAYIFIPWTIISSLNFISEGINSVFIVNGVLLEDEQNVVIDDKIYKRNFMYLVLLLSVASLIIYNYSELILGIYNDTIKVGALNNLKILCGSIVPWGIYSVLLAREKIILNYRIIIIGSVLPPIITLFFSLIALNFFAISVVLYVYIFSIFITIFTFIIG